MQKVLSAFKLSDKKQKRLLQESQISSTDSSFTQDENIKPDGSFTPDVQRSRTNSFKPLKLLRTPSVAEGGSNLSTPRKAVVGGSQHVSTSVTTDMVSLGCMLHATGCLSPLTSSSQQLMLAAHHSAISLCISATSTVWWRPSYAPLTFKTVTQRQWLQPIGERLQHAWHPCLHTI